MCVRTVSTGGRTTMTRECSNPDLERYRTYRLLVVIELVVGIVALVVSIAATLGFL